MSTMQNLKRISKRFVVPFTLGLATGVLVPTVQARQVTIPVVADGVAGRNGSVWDTEVRILRLRSDESLQIRRVWVALPTGGFADDPSTAPRWSRPANASGLYYSPGLILLVGSDLLAGSDSKIGAVGLEVDGEAAIYFRTVETAGRPRQPQAGQPYELCCFSGTGALVNAPGDALSGVGLLPWLSPGDPLVRANVTFVNPGASTIDFEIGAYGFWCYGITSFDCDREHTTPYWELGGYEGHTYEAISLPPFGWLQLSDFYSHLSNTCPVGGCSTSSAVSPGLGVIFPVKDGELDLNGQYYAYASIIDTATNSGMFEMAVPGGLGILSSSIKREK